MPVSWAVAGLAKVVCPQAYAHGEIVKLGGVGVGVAGGAVGRADGNGVLPGVGVGVGPVTLPTAFTVASW